MKTKSENTAPRGGKGKGEGKRERAEKRRERRKEGSEKGGERPKEWALRLRRKAGSPHRPCSAAPPSPAHLHRPHTTKLPRPD